MGLALEQGGDRSALGRDPTLRRQAILLFALTVLGLSLMQPRISVTDSDARAYIEGAYSIQAGAGYQDLTGHALNHWPPGYSLLLSLFPQPLRAALVINYLSGGIVVASIFLLTRKIGWDAASASGIALALGFGFFRGVGINAKPDILTYALFLMGAQCLGSAREPVRTMGACLWSMLTVLKLIAVVFAPALLLVDWFLLRDRSPSFRRIDYIYILGLWLITLAAVVGFNYYTLKVIVPATHEASGLIGYVQELVRFGSSFLRTFLVNWYGSIRKIQILLPLGVTLLVALVCLLSLRPRAGGRKYAYIGLAMLVLSWGLEIVKRFNGDMRLMGYGPLLLLLAFRPVRGAWKFWIASACASILLATANSLTANSLGVNDPRYARLAFDVLAVAGPHEPIYSNSYHILDIHARLPSIPAENLDGVPPGAAFLKIDLPSYDAIQQTIWRIEQPPKTWPVLARWKEATLYRKPAAK
jgi:hypothetical protein